jgi:alpha-mannosidase
VDARVKVVNRAGDHRLRLLFPTGAEVDRFDAATTLDAAVRTTEPVSGAGWVHPVPSTFCHQGWISAGRLTVSAPGLPEAEVTPDGVVALTLVRSVGWLSRYDLQTRPVPAGPAVEAPGAQTLGAVEASVSLLARSAPADTARRTRDAEAGLWGVLGGPEPRLEPGRPLLRLEGDGVVLSALKPADDGEGLVTRVLNPTDQTARARIHLGFAVGAVEGVRLDELPDDRVELAATDGGLVTVEVPARSLRSIRLRPV